MTQSNAASPNAGSNATSNIAEASLVVLDPTAGKSAADLQPAPRRAGISGLTVGLLDISKPRGDVFLDRIESHLDRLGAKVVRFRKPTFTKPAPVDLRHEIAVNCNAVIEALAD